jgi:flagellar biosynthesis protein FlhB
MSEGPDKESKTELPTEKRISDALEKGNTPLSREVITLGSMLAMLSVGGLMTAEAASRLTQFLARLLAQASTLDFRVGADAAVLLRDSFSTVATIILPPLIVIAAGGIVASLAQNMPQASVERLTPKYQRISPSANGARIFGKQAMIEFAKICLKTAVVVAVTVHAMRGELQRLLATSSNEISQIPAIALDLAMAILAPLCLLALLLGVADATWTRIKWRRDLMMTRQEVKDEHKQSEGDGQIKQRIRMIGRQRQNKNMMSELPKATVVVVNPTHFAVALRYVAAEGGAPVVIARGVDYLALRIREGCEELGIPRVENKPLARALYGSTKIGDSIPTEFYRSVAEVIHFIEMRKRLATRRV